MQQETREIFKALVGTFLTVERKAGMAQGTKISLRTDLSVGPEELPFDPRAFARRLTGDCYFMAAC